MFVGEMGCWLVVLIASIFNRFTSRSRGYTPITDQTREEVNPALKPLVAKEDGRIPLRGWKILYLALPSTCDIAGTTLMNVGLFFVAASIYQMTRGALVLFVGLFSVMFLKRKLFGYQWLALLVVVIGVGLVGLAGYISPGSATPSPQSTKEASKMLVRAVVLEARAAAQSPEAIYTIIGVLMIAGAQIFTATQFVFEEFILEKYSMEPLKMVGWEGIFGFLVTVIGMGVLHLIIGRTDAGRYGYFDAVEGWREITTNKNVLLSSLLIMISIGGFNFFGLSVTRTVSATSRSTIDTCRTLFIWIVSLGLGWETFKWLQIGGFVLLVYGTFLFNDIVGLPWQRFVKSNKHQALMPEEPIEHS
jgi:drug/metabolite transporter (DMT)-like permease